MSSIEQTDRESAAFYKAPRVALKDIEDAIAHQYDVNAAEAVGAGPGFVVKPDGSSGMESLRLLSVCFLVMKNGFTVIGKSAPASPENFNAAYGKKLAYEDAIRQLWPLMGFALRDRLHEAQTYADAKKHLSA